jgi:hypothetical protein
MKPMSVLTLLILTIAGCNPVDTVSEAIGEKVAEKVTEKVIEQAIEEDSENVDVKIKDGKISIKTDKGEMKLNAGADITLPGDFPKDVYVPENAKIVMAMAVPDGFTVTFHSKLSADDIMTKYLEKNKSQKWVKKSLMDMGPQKIAVFVKGRRILNIMMTKDDQSNETMGHITVSLKK